MEAALLIFDVAGLVAAILWAIKNDNTNGPTTGLFRFKDQVSNPSAPSTPTAPGWRRSR